MTFSLIGRRGPGDFRRSCERPCGFLNSHGQFPTVLDISSSRDLHFPAMVGGVNRRNEADSATTAEKQTLVFFLLTRGVYEKSNSSLAAEDTRRSADGSDDGDPDSDGGLYPDTNFPRH